MNERAIFTEALDRDTPADRAAYLDTACAGDPALRARVEALLRSHEEAGDFPGRLAPQRLADEFAAREPGDTGTGPAVPEADGLDFLDPSDRPGSIGRLGHYEVQEVVGRGGMGVVLRAFDERLHRVVAIKVIAAQLATSATARRRFVREARAAAAVTHDHVVTIHAVEGDDRLPHIVMQYVAGASLQDRLDRSGSLPLAEVLRIGMQTAAGLAAAHAQGLVHRDVKPANILLENGVERVRLTDFGLARAADDASLTQSGTVAGTPSFMSPEQAEGKSVDHRSDLFSLGSVLYAMCTGRPPFRAGTNMGVLKRVCEETPKPIRETNSEIPDWLIAVVEKLHAKDPAARFQSAAEVAELLGRHLARVQHPSVVPLPAVAKSAEPEPARPERRRRWAVALLVAVVTALAAAEATGVTNVRATVIRIFTPDGTLVVETDDPAVKVVVEGDGDLVITGAGPQEVRLRAGSYKVRATRDGKPVKLDRDLVTITRGDRQIVRVRLEDEPPAVAQKAEREAFVVLGSRGVPERKFDTLAEAVQDASKGDTIEVRGNGPFVSDGVTIGNPLVIRAGEGYKPSITLSKASADKNIPLLWTFTPLVLEGLELRRIGGAGFTGDSYPFILMAGEGGILHVANCRLIIETGASRTGQGVYSAAPVCVLRNCEYLTNSLGCAVGWYCPTGGRGTFENCVTAHGGMMAIQLQARDLTDVVVNIRRNTAVECGPSFGLYRASQPAKPSVRLNFESNVIWSRYASVPQAIFTVHQVQLEPPLSEQDAAALLTSLVSLHEQHNVYPDRPRMMQHWRMTSRDFQPPEAKSVRTLADWNRLWKQRDTGSVEGTVRVEGGDLLSRVDSAPEKLTAVDFRLRPHSAGYKAGQDGKDLGADVDLVGPGAAYERWKKTPEYQQWLKDTGQVKK